MSKKASSKRLALVFPVGGSGEELRQEMRPCSSSEVAMRIATVILMIGVVTTPARADLVPLERPAECVPVLTVQFRECRVMTALHCGSEEGGYVRLEHWVGTGFDYISHETADGIAIGIRFSDGSILETNAAFSKGTPVKELLRSGAGEMTQIGRVVGSGTPIPVGQKFSFALSASIDVSGGQLEEFEVSGSINFDSLLGSVTGKAYFHPSVGILFEGQTTVVFEGEQPQLRAAFPASLSFPGDLGFDEKSPSVGCFDISGLVRSVREKHA